MIPGQAPPMLTNPMMQQQLNPVDPRAEQMRQMMIIMGGLGPKIPPQPAGQAVTTNPLNGMGGYK